MKKLPAKIIDFHVHLFPDNFFVAWRNYFKKNYGWELFYPFFYENCISFLKDRDVELIIYSNFAHKKGIAEILNEWNLKVIDEMPCVFCFAAYHPDDDEALHRAEILLEHPKILGFKLQILVQKFYPQDERLFPLYELVIDKKKRILFHIGNGPFANEFLGIHNFRKVLERYPGLPANVAHMGGYEYQEFLELLDEYPNVYLDTSFSFSPKAPCIFNLSNEYLERYQDRIVYGSDFPGIFFPIEDEIKYLLDLNLSQSFYDKVFRTNGLFLIENEELYYES